MIKTNLAQKEYKLNRSGPNGRNGETFENQLSERSEKTFPPYETAFNDQLMYNNDCGV